MKRAYRIASEMKQIKTAASQMKGKLHFQTSVVEMKEVLYTLNTLNALFLVMLLLPSLSAGEIKTG